MTPHADLRNPGPFGPPPPLRCLTMVKPIALADLADAMQITGGELVSLVGGGGKTTTLFTLGEQLAGTTVLTTTTKMGAEQSSNYPVLIDPTDTELRTQLAAAGRALVWKAADDRRAIGVDGKTCDRWFTIADNVVVEADGSRKRPFKAPADHEPVIPSDTTLLVACIGASAFGRPIAESCHRPELVAALADCTVADPLTPARAAAILLSPAGSQKGLPAGARFLVALHRVTEQTQGLVSQLAAQLGEDALLVAVREAPRL
jgi:molybdenum cofactor cytidylyltransferase